MKRLFIKTISLLLAGLMLLNIAACGRRTAALRRTPGPGIWRSLWGGDALWSPPWSCPHIPGTPTAR
jgi:hypothetical protein